MNMVEKILARAAGKKETRPGEVVVANVNLMVMHDLSANFVMRVFRDELGGGKILDPSRIAFVFDHNFSPATREAATTLHTVRQFAAEHGIKNLFDCGSGSLHLYEPDVASGGNNGRMFAGDKRALCYRIVSPASTSSSDSQNIQIIVTAQNP